MIPFVIQQTCPKDYITQPNIVVEYYSSFEDKLHETIINIIINIIFEFCSTEWGHDIKISSYDDFCYHYWNINGIFSDHFYLFQIYYFQNNNWNYWNIDNYKTDIYTSYINKYSS